MDEFRPYRHYIKEKELPFIKFEIIVETPNKFHVRFPDFDYIKMTPKLSVEYDLNQLLLFLLLYDKKQCLEFMEKLYAYEGCSGEYIKKLRENPVFCEI